MSNKVRFIDNVKVGAYKTITSGESTNLIISNNSDNRILTATGLDNEINGESQLIFNGESLGLGTESPEAAFEINEANGNDLLLIKNTFNQGIKVNSDGVLQLLEFISLPNAIKGGIAYSGSSFYFGIE